MVHITKLCFDIKYSYNEKIQETRNIVSDDRSTALPNSLPTNLVEVAIAVTVDNKNF